MIGFGRVCVTLGLIWLFGRRVCFQGGFWTERVGAYTDTVCIMESSIYRNSTSL